MKPYFKGMHLFRQVGNVADGPVKASEIITGHIKITTSGTALRITATPTPLRYGVHFVSDETLSSKRHYIGTTENKPTYDSGASGAKSSGQAVSFNNSVFWECRDLSEIWIDADEDDKTLTYMAI